MSKNYLEWQGRVLHGTRAGLAVLASCAWLAGCSGEIVAASSMRAGPPPSAEPPAAGSGAANTPEELGAYERCTALPVPAVTRIARLTHRQYQNSLRDLTGLDLPVIAEFLPDPHQAGFDRGIDLQVGDVLAADYRDMAERAASALVSDSAAYARVLGCSPDQGDACAKTFIASFGKRALRRPLTAAEQTRYLELFHSGAELFDSGDDFQRGVRITVEALLQSPKFLYRAELTPGAALSPYETAARLSYLLVNSTPDAALMAAADMAQLASEDDVAQQAARLLSGAAARETVRDFHHQWLDLDVFPNKLTKDPQRYPNVTPALAPLLQQEVERFVDAISFDRKRGFVSLLTAPLGFVNKTTAAIYGVRGTFGDGLQQVELDPSQRAGLLTQIGFLASRAYSQGSSPIHRGVFIQRRMLCNMIPDPPANVPALPPVDGTTIKTTRQQVDQHTAPAACASCHHALINPVGFGLENYDAVGAYRTSENGVAIDATGTLAGTAAGTAFSSGVELSRALADAPEARACYATSWFRYVLGRVEQAADVCAISAIAARLDDDSYTPVALLTDLARSPSFRARSGESP